MSTNEDLVWEIICKQFCHYDNIAEYNYIPYKVPAQGTQQAFWFLPLNMKSIIGLKVTVGYMTATHNIFVESAAICIYEQAYTQSSLPLALNKV